MPVVWISDDASFGRAPYCAGVSNGRGEDLNDKFATAVTGPDWSLTRQPSQHKTSLE